MWSVIVSLDRHNAPRAASAMAFDAFLSLIPLAAFAGYVLSRSHEWSDVVVRPLLQAAPPGRRAARVGGALPAVPVVGGRPDQHHRLPLDHVLRPLDRHGRVRHDLQHPRAPLVRAPGHRGGVCDGQPGGGARRGRPRRADRVALGLHRRPHRRLRPPRGARHLHGRRVLPALDPAAERRAAPDLPGRGAHRGALGDRVDPVLALRRHARPLRHVLREPRDRRDLPLLAVAAGARAAHRGRAERAPGARARRRDVDPAPRQMEPARPLRARPELRAPPELHAAPRRRGAPRQRRGRGGRRRGARRPELAAAAARRRVAPASIGVDCGQLADRGRLAEGRTVGGRRLGSARAVKALSIVRRSALTGRSLARWVRAVRAGGCRGRASGGAVERARAPRSSG
ncbi:uncharacterized protein SOCE26_077660 [Sorangium cellulosum]|uniref:Uncharacterized protein n=1 Tax=Sorangium cellulosum TaxID=56 RepID=A0A2L0F428_SORCE|nr:uncharacterized protein SOCE26_077660 [Sorangium cellulosum]